MTSERINAISLSPTLKIADKAKTMKASGIDLVDLSVGEPDFPTPDNIKAAALKALDENRTHYTQGDGIPELKEAIIYRLRRDHDIYYEPNNIIVSCGAKQSLYNLFQVLLDPDDEVIIPAPYWVSYAEQVNLAQGKPVIVTTHEENGFRLTAEELKNNVTFKTRALVINNPSNPTGSTYSEEQLRELAQVAVEEGLYIVADEIYEKIVYDGFRFVSLASIGEDVQANTVIINGVSKAYSMTGWRIGFAAGPRDVISAMNKLQSHSTSNPNSIAQYASVEALRGPQHAVSQMVAEFQKRRNVMLQRLSRIPGISCYEPQGAFYLFPNIACTFGKESGRMMIRNSFGLAYYLLKEAHLAVVPGEAFGDDNYIRLSYATSLEQIERGMDRLEAALSRLKTAARVKRMKLHNVRAHPARRIEPLTTMEVGDREALVNEAEHYLLQDLSYTWNANIAGVIVQLRTNSSHIYDFWIENWYPAQLDTELEPHGFVYAVKNVPGRAPSAFYHSDSHTAVIFNTNYYSQVRQAALAVVGDLGDGLLQTHLVRAAVLELNQKGILLFSSSSKMRELLTFTLLAGKRAKLLSPDVAVARYGPRKVVVDCLERKYYLRTSLDEYFPHFTSVFEKCHCENVITSHNDCTYPNCTLEDCLIDRGEMACFFASRAARAMVDPLWITGTEKHVKRLEVHNLFLLMPEGYGPAAQKIDGDELLRLINGSHTGEISSHRTGSEKNPFLNPYLLGMDERRKVIQQRSFDLLSKSVQCHRILTQNRTLQELTDLIERCLEE